MSGVIESLQRAGIKAMVVSVDLTEPVPVYRVALSKDGFECESMHASGLGMDVAVRRALGHE